MFPMTSPLSSRRRSKTPPPGETVKGWIEYFDDGMLRLTREGKPNLFIYKHQIRTIAETGKRRGPAVGSLVAGVIDPDGSSK